ncbi:MAG: type II secretion system minor pseudopilin GspK [Gammaproteobacteria bacterium]|nr:type II secretion system minor pseudopilin GspK [Gammaproteobacteria bacterium]
MTHLAFSHRQEGSALVIALVIVAIATLLATSIMWSNHLDQRRLEIQLHGEQAWQYALGAESWTGFLLSREDAEVDHLQEPWATENLVLPVEGGFIEGQLSDLQSRFNLNNLVDAEDNVRQEQLDIFRRLLANLALDPIIADATVDWLDRNIDPNGFNGAEDALYTRYQPAYRTANRPMHSISELRLVNGMTAEQFQLIEPFVAALPVRVDENSITRINLNTAPAELLAALSDELTVQDAESLVQARMQAPFSQVSEAENIVGQQRLPQDAVSVNSNYFRLRTLVGVGSVEISLYSVLERRNDGTRVVRHSRGTL